MIGKSFPETDGVSEQWVNLDLNIEMLAEYLTEILRPVSVDDKNLDSFKKMINSVKVIRSFELAIMAFEFGMFEKYSPKSTNSKKTLLEAVLWGVKLNGCSVSEQEINDVMNLLGL